MSELILIVGVSTRALAESAVQAGHRCTTVDYFGDIDQRAMVPNVGLEPDLGVPYSAEALVDAAERVQASSVVYGASLENHPDAVAQLAAGRELLGNGPTTLRRVRHIGELAHVLGKAGIPVPTTLAAALASSADPQRSWLRKPTRSGGGLGVARWRLGEELRSDETVQEFVEGTPGSAVVVANGRRASVLGISRQIVGSRAFGGSGFRYCGNILPLTDDAGEFRSVLSQLRRAAEATAAGFCLRGVFGIDFVLLDRRVCVLELNPRYTASMELVERAYGISIFDTHVRACRGSAPPFDLGRNWRSARTHGKAILFADRPITLGDTLPWLDDRFRVRDVPRPGTKIVAGAPILTLFADAKDPQACEHLLKRLARLRWASLLSRGTMNGGPS